MSVIDVCADLLRKHPLPSHDEGGDKQLRGRVLIIGGSVQVPGAVLLSGHGALRAGAGVLRIATCRSSAVHLAVAMPESRVTGFDETAEGGIDAGAAEPLADDAGECEAVLIGPGMMDGDATAALTARMLQTPGDAGYVLDAAAFTTLDPAGPHPSKLVVTPHAGEMAHFLDVEREEIEADPIKAGREVARRLGAVVAVKGAETHIVEPGGRIWCSRNGSIGLGTSGSGDVLAGIITGLLARGTSADLAVVWGVYLHAEAGRRLEQRYGRLGLLARELPAEIPAIMRDLSQG
jgi:ADP-dependent NAD(P)H-hydrate dehydratase